MSIEPVPKLKYLNKFHIHGIVLTVFEHSYSINRDAHLRETIIYVQYNEYVHFNIYFITIHCKENKIVHKNRQFLIFCLTTTEKPAPFPLIFIKI